ncbi:MAG TPA: SPOR domain-containing protein [Gemmatimonadaceae bacterium]|nr:SPOR domain-containing protein [Gemmatimonadaceae bacterium]
MRHLSAILLAGGVLVAAPLYAQNEAPTRTPAQTSTQAQPPEHAATPAPAAAEDDVFERARRLVAAGQGDTGRNLIESELNAADSGSARYVEALYWRAVLAKTAADAERDLRTIVIYYPLSTESDDALMRLAQLEMTRGETEQAMGHLERVVKEHPRSASRPRASFWMARMLFDKGKDAEACRHLADAAASTPAGQVELRNQIDYLMPRCAGIDTTTPAAAPVKSAAPSKAPAPSAPVKPATPGKPATSAPAASTRGATPAAAPSAEASHEFTVQVAAFASHESAEKLRARLKELGYDARIASDEPPYRVRVGRYATREQADSVAARMKTQHVDGYVTSAEARR